MTTSEFDDYKVDHLFLLIGENPLPNYVAAKLLLREGGKPLLVYSERTQEPANRLREELGLSDNEMVALDNNEANAYEIKKRIREKIKEIQKEHPDKNKFGLNYTGGTKAMAAHAYQALLSYELNHNPIFSYLDSSSLKMLIDQENGNPIPLNISKEPLELSLEKLFGLHGLSLSKSKPSKPNIKRDITLPELVEAIVKNDSLWREWCKKNLSIEGREKEEIKKVEKDNNTEIYFTFIGWKNGDELRDLSLAINKLPEDIIAILQNNNFLDEQGRLSIQKIITAQENRVKETIIPKPKKTRDYPVDICKWLEGIWLEDYVLQQLKSIKEECSLDDIGMSFNFPEKKEKEKQDVFFEFDVACLRGYQLFAISCTTDNTPKLCKSKLFEAYRRARQMGGDEARVALICYSDKPEKIKQSFMSQINDSRVMLFGSKHIEKLADELKNWIQEVG